MLYHELISSVLNEHKAFNNIWFAGDYHTPAVFSYQVNFPRLELVLNGIYINEMENNEHQVTDIVAKPGDAIYIPPNCWNNPNWENRCTVLSILFGKRQLGFSLVNMMGDGESDIEVQQHSIPTRSGFAIDNILEALNSLARESNKKIVDELLLQALLQYSKRMLEQPQNPSIDRLQGLYQNICIHVQENFHKPISRETIAKTFNVSANHLSRVFRQQGHMTLADYIVWVRIDRAKFMLRKYDFKLFDVATRCGFNDVNYFCRVFKKRTGFTPSEYRNVK